MRRCLPRCERSAVIAYLVKTSGGASSAAAASPGAVPKQAQAPASAPAKTPAPQHQSTAAPAASMGAYVPGIRYTLRSGIADGRMVFIGVGGTIV